MRKPVTIALGAVLVTALGVPLGSSVATAATCGAKDSTSVTPDFDGDNSTTPDSAIGIPGEGLGTQAGAGAVEVRYASGKTQILHVTDYKAGDRFGTSVADADVNGDGCTDLLVGAPGRDVAGKADAGAVFVYLGSPSGLAYSRTLMQGSGGVPGGPQPGARLGSAVAYDPDRSGGHVNEYWLGMPGRDVGGKVDAGGVVALQIDGTKSPAAISGSVLTEGTGGVPGTLGAGNRFGAAIAATGTGFAAGAPGETVSGHAGAGAVVEELEELGANDAVTRSYQHFTQDTAKVEGAAENGDGFGSAVAYSSAGGLVVGVPGEDVGSVADAGMIDIIRYVEQPTGDFAYEGAGVTQNSTGVPGDAEAGDRFGAAVATWDPFWEDQDYRYGIVQVGVPGEDIGSVHDAGMVDTVKSVGSASAGTASGKSGIGSLTETTTAGKVEAGDRFGSALAGATHGVGAGATEDTTLWSIGAPGGDKGAGAVVVAERTGFDQKPTGTSRIWKQVTGSPEPGDAFGSALAARTVD